MGDVFGTRMQIAGECAYGPIDRDHAVSIPYMIDLAQRIVKAIGMTCSHPVQVTDYPAKDGEPSPGFLILQPIIESAVLLDVWPPLQRMYVHVISCRQFDSTDIFDLIEDEGFNMLDYLNGTLEG